jgi:hypothetical protein
MNWIKHPLELRHLGVLSGASETIFWAYGMFSTILHLSWTDTNTISKWTKMRFHTTHVTLEFHRVRPKRFLSLWYVRRKPCNYLASSLALSPIRLNRASTWALTPRSTIGCVQNNFSAFNQKKILCLRYVWRKPCTYLSLTPTLCWNGLKRDSTWPTWPWSSIGCVQNDFWGCGTFGTNRAPILRQD